MLLKYERVTGDQFVAVYDGEDMDAVMNPDASAEPEDAKEEHSEDTGTVVPPCPEEEKDD